MTISDTSAAFKGALTTIDGAVFFSGDQHVDTVLAYYRDNQHQHVDERDPAKLTQEVQDGRLLLITANDKIVAASSAFNYSADGASDRATWVEIGATRVTLGGFGFYPFIIASQVMEECLERPPENYIFANIYGDNTAVKHLLGTKTGWDEFTASTDADLEAAYSRKNQADTVEMADWIWLRSTPNCLPHQANIVKGITDEPIFINKKDPANPVQLVLDTSNFSLATPDKAEKVETMATGRFADFLIRRGEHITCESAMKALNDGNTESLEDACVLE